jgi:NADPH:quinone reductase-like Zn-dependent oxidoreductase
MRRVRYHAHGGPEVLAVEEAVIPEPGPGQVLIRAEAIGVDYVDVQLRRETDPDSIWFRPLPGVLTGDVVGTVEKTGPGTEPAWTWCSRRWAARRCTGASGSSRRPAARWSSAPRRASCGRLPGRRSRWPR